MWLPNLADAAWLADVLPEHAAAVGIAGTVDSVRLLDARLTHPHRPESPLCRGWATCAVTVGDGEPARLYVRGYPNAATSAAAWHQGHRPRARRHSARRLPPRPAGGGDGAGARGPRLDAAGRSRGRPRRVLVDLALRGLPAGVVRGVGRGLLTSYSTASGTAIDEALLEICADAEFLNRCYRHLRRHAPGWQDSLAAELARHGDVLALLPPGYTVSPERRPPT